MLTSLAGCSTRPTVEILAFSGRRFWFGGVRPPTVVEQFELSRLLPRSASVATFDFSKARAMAFVSSQRTVSRMPPTCAKTPPVPDSARLGARKPSEYVPRSIRSGRARQITPSLGARLAAKCGYLSRRAAALTSRVSESGTTTSPNTAAMVRLPSNQEPPCCVIRPFAASALPGVRKLSRMMLVPTAARTSRSPSLNRVPSSLASQVISLVQDSMAKVG